MNLKTSHPPQQEIAILKKELAELKAKHDLIIHNSTVEIWSTDLNFNLTYVSPTTELIFGYAVEERLKLSINDIFVPDSAEKIHQIIKKFKNAIQQKKTMNVPFTIELEAFHKNGQTVWIELKADLLHDKDGKIIGIQGSSRDVTDRKTAENDLINAKEKAEESNKLKTAFLTNLSHEIRTPMNGIIGFTDLLLKSDLPKEKQGFYLDIIRKSGKELLTIVEDIISASKLDAKEESCASQKICLNEVIQEVYDSFWKIASDKNLVINMQLEQDREHSYIYGDKPKIKRMLSNLINNSLKFTDQGHIEFGYNVISEKHIELFVSDTGIGIAPEHHEKIFNRFWQVDSGPTRKYGGTGLGLTISKGLAELMGGHMQVESEPEKGSLFRVILPYRPASGLRSSVKPATKEEFAKWPDRKVLIVEDEIINFIYLEELFSKTGIQISHAISGNEAIEKILAESYDIVLMDIKLPGIDGIQTTKIIRKNHPHLPVIAQTAYAYEEDKKHALEAGCNDYITKPIKKEKLFPIMDKYLS
jgi:PAS domain S-box-containing protein